MKTLAPIVATLVLGAWLTPVHAEDKELAQSIQGAAQDLADGEWRKARHELDKANADLTATRDDGLRAQYTFYSALVDHRCSDDASVPAAEREAARKRAIDGYEAYLKWNPGSGGALNNAAQLYARDPEQHKKALEYYDRAVALKDPRVATYSLNRAKLLADMGSADQALQASRAVTWQAPGNVEARDFTLRLLETQGKTADIADYIRQMAEGGRVDGAIDTALSELDRLTAAREPVLVALAETLANPSLTMLPDRVADSETGRRLGKHATDGEIGTGVAELLRLFGLHVGPAEMVWWRRDFDPHEELRPKTRAYAALNLARALGDRCRQAGPEHYTCAEDYYRFAIEFTGATADPQAFLALAQILASTGRQEQLAVVAKQYEHALYNGKQTAYGNDSKPSIFKFHMALGTMYAYLGKWEDPQTPWAGAIFQLEHARSIAGPSGAHVYHGPPPRDPMHFPEEAAELLSDGYARIGKADQSAQVRVDLAEQYLAAGDRQSAAQLLSKEWHDNAPKTTNRQVMERAAAASQRAGANWH